jgi:hypothetical protein
MEIKTTFDLITLFSTIASLILVIIAIYLSVVFYKMSNIASAATTEASKGIAASVERLEKLFDKLYADTFSIMRDTVTDMRKHIWPADGAEQNGIKEEAEKKADAKFTELKSSMEKQISDMLSKQNLADAKMRMLKTEMNNMLNKVIVKSREVEAEAREETLRESIIKIISSYPDRQLPISRILAELDCPASSALREIKKMEQDGAIEMNSAILAPNSEIRLARPKAPAARSSYKIRY